MIYLIEQKRIPATGKSSPGCDWLNSASLESSSLPLNKPARLRLADPANMKLGRTWNCGYSIRGEFLAAAIAPHGFPNQSPLPSLPRCPVGYSRRFSGSNWYFRHSSQVRGIAGHRIVEPRCFHYQHPRNRWEVVMTGDFSFHNLERRQRALRMETIYATLDQPERPCDPIARTV
jgi:hypothetical protein